MKYKIGDKVKMKDKMPHRGFRPSKMNKFEGKIMTIANTGFLPFIGDYYQMKEGDFIWFGEKDIDRLIDEHKIVITSDGKTTTAKLYDGKKFIKEATAKCSPEDEFDFKIGAELAVERLFTDEFFTGKAVYIGGDLFTIGRTRGKIYEFKNGFYYDDANDKRPAFWDKGFTKDEVVQDGFLPIKE